jgi:predicted PurR-regulated permease PerM
MPSPPLQDRPPPDARALSRRRHARLLAHRAEHRALAVAAALAVGVIFWIAMPVGIGILLGALLAFSLQTTFDRIVARTRRPALTAIGFVVGVATSLLLAFGALSWLLVTRGLILAQKVVVSLGPGGGLRGLMERVSGRLSHLGLPADDVSSRLSAAVADIATRAAAVATGVAASALSTVLLLFFTMMTLSYVLVSWPELSRRFEEMLPLRTRDTHALLEELRRAGRATLLGTVMTGFAQGGLAAIGYWFSGLPEPAFFGALTAVVSLLPVIGTLAVWVPAGIYLIATGQILQGALELTWGALVVVGFSDYVLRPRLIERGSTMPPRPTPGSSAASRCSASRG